MRQKKLLLSIVLVLVLTTVFAVAAMAETKSGQVAPETHGDKLVYSFDTESGELVISGTATSLSFDKNEKGGVNWNNMAVVPWYAFKNQVKSVKITAPITSISNYSFNNCENIEKVVFPTTLKKWDDCWNVFSNAKKLNSIAFGSDYGAANVFDLKNLTECTKGAFQMFENANLGTITIYTPVNGAKVFDALAFNGSFKATKLVFWVVEGGANETVADTLTSKATIEKNYYDLDELLTWSFVNEEANDLKWAFDPATGTLKFKGENATELRLATTTGGLSYNSKDWSVNVNVLPWYSNINQIKKVVFDAPKLTKLPELLFYNHTKIQEVVIPASLDTLATAVFQQCQSLNTITVSGNKSVTGTIDISNVKSVGGNLFENALANVELVIKTHKASDATTINNTTLKNVSRTNSITFYVTEGSANDTAAKAIKAAATKFTVNIEYYDPMADLTWTRVNSKEGTDDLVWAFNDVTKTLYIKSTTTKVLDLDALQSWDKPNTQPWKSLGVKKIVISGAITEIGQYMFADNKSLETVIIPEKLTKTGDNIFTNCSALSSVAYSEDTVVANVIDVRNVSDLAGYLAEAACDYKDITIYVHPNAKVSLSTFMPNNEWHKPKSVTFMVVKGTESETSAKKIPDAMDALTNANRKFTVKIDYYEAVIKPVDPSPKPDAPTIQDTKTAYAVYGTPTLDGKIDAAWNDAAKIEFPYDRNGCDVDNLAGFMDYTGTTAPYAKVMWDEDALYVLYVVYDENLNVASDIATYNRDSVELYIDELNEKLDNLKGTTKYVQGWAQLDGASATGSGFSCKAGKLDDNTYVLECKYEFTAVTPKADTVIGFDVSINVNKTGENTRDHSLSWNDRTNCTWYAPCYMGNLKLVGANSQTTKNAKAQYGTPTIDGKIDEMWTKAETIDFPYDRNDASEGSLAGLMDYTGRTAPYAKAMWDGEYLYVLFVVNDTTPYTNLSDFNNQNYLVDSVEVYVDETNSKASSNSGLAGYHQYVATIAGDYIGTGGATLEVAKGKLDDNTYVIETKYKFEKITPATGSVIGFDVAINANDNGVGRDHSLSWNDRTNMAWANPSYLGNLELVGSAEVDPNPNPNPNPDPDPDPKPEPEPDTLITGIINSTYVKNQWVYNETTKVITITPTAKGWNETGSWKDIADSKVWSEIIKEAVEIVVTNADTGFAISKVSGNAFNGASNVKKITLANTCGQVNTRAFEGCSSLTTIVIEGNTEIQGVVDASVFTSVGQGLGNTYGYMFNGATNVKKMILADSFSDKAPVLDICLPLSSLEEIWGNTEYVKNYAESKNIKFVTYKRLSASSYVTIDGDTDTLTLYVNGGDEIPAITVSDILGAENVKRIVVESTVKKIADNAFAGFTALESAQFKGFAPEAGATIFGTKTDSFVIDVNADCGFDDDNDGYWNGYKLNIAAATPFVKGDINGDGVISARDAIALAQYLAEWTVENFNVKAADVDGDGVVTSSDTVKLSKYLAEWLTTLD